MVSLRLLPLRHLCEDNRQPATTEKSFNASAIRSRCRRLSSRQLSRLLRPLYRPAASRQAIARLLSSAILPALISLRPSLAHLHHPSRRRTAWAVACSRHILAARHTRLRRATFLIPTREAACTLLRSRRLDRQARAAICSASRSTRLV